MQHTEVVAAATGTRGATGRVTAVHAQARPGLALSVVFVVAAAVAALVDWSTGWWVPLHLLLVGGLLGAISTVTQMLAVTWSASPAPSSAIVVAQRAGLAVGTILLVAGRESGHDTALVVGGALVASSMLGLAAVLWWIRRTAVTRRFAPAIEGYVVAVGLGTVGMVIGILLATGRLSSSYERWRDAHLVLNVLGLVGVVIASTLPYFAATQVRARMSDRATPAAIRLTIAALAIATVGGAAGAAAAVPALVAASLSVYALGLVAVVTMLPVGRRASLAWGGPRVVQLLTGIGWWTSMTVVVGVSALDGRVSTTAIRTLIVGGYLQILAASVAYLAPVLRGGGHQRLSEGFAATRSWTGLVAGNVVAVGVLLDGGVVVAVGLGIWLLDGAGRGLRLARRATTTQDGDHSIDGVVDRADWRRVAVPSEHGGWSLTLEPVILGLVVAPSSAGFALGGAAVLAFLARTPGKLVLVDLWRRRWLRRTGLAARLASVEVAAIAVLGVVAARGAGEWWWLPLAGAAPLVLTELWFDMRSRGRRLVPELAGSVGMGSVAAAVALAGRADPAVAVGLWVVLGARAIGAIAAARTQVFRLHRRPVRRLPTDLAQLLAVGAVAVGWWTGSVPIAAAVTVAVISVVQMVSIRRPVPSTAKVIGFRQLGFGLLVVIVTAVAVRVAA